MKLADGEQCKNNVGLGTFSFFNGCTDYVIICT